MSLRSQFRSQISHNRSLGLSDEEVDAIIQGFANEDEPSGKTWSRRLVEGYLSHVSGCTGMCCYLLLRSIY